MLGEFWMQGGMMDADRLGGREGRESPDGREATTG